MISIDALEAAGLSNKILKKILTAEPPPRKGKAPIQPKPDKAPLAMSSPVFQPYLLEKLPDKPSDWDKRCFLETMIRGEVIEGQMRCAKNFNVYATMDLAYASLPIHPLVSDLVKCAMGYISLEQCEANISRLSPTSKNSLFERDAKGKAVAVNFPKLIEVSHNLVHSLVTRRVAALATEVYQQYPLMKFDPFSNNQTGRLVGDVMTQLAEQMAGAYGYRHDYEESIRQASLYTTSFKFKANRWDVEKQVLPEYTPTPAGARKTGRDAKPQLKPKIVREGVRFVIPHPSRVGYDISEPVSKLNNDCGPKWINHWEVVPVGDVLDNPAYFNRDALALDNTVYTWFQSYASYFSQYYTGTCITLDNAERINPLCVAPISAAAMSLSNDRVAQIGVWAQNYRSVGTILTQHYKRIIPKDYGLGTYEHPVWVRFVMAANTTIVYAEIVGSAPASVNSYNASDGLLISPSFAMQAVQYQQMLTNHLTELAHVQAQGLVRIWALNTDGMSKDEIERVEMALKNPDFSQLKDVVIKYKRKLLVERAEDPRNITEKITQIRVETASKTNEIFNNIVQTLAIAERLMFFSPQELGQVSPRTVTATEMKAVRDTTLGIRDFHLIGVKQQIDADKRILHDSYMAFGSEDLEVPVAERYEPKVIEAAGFEIIDDGTGNPPDGLYTIRGKKLGLLYNYTYSTRNTDDTPPEAAVAQGLTQLYEILAKDPVLAENTTLEQRMELFNSLAGIMSANVFKLRVPPGSDGKKTGASVVTQMQQQLQQFLPAVGNALKQVQEQQAAMEQKIAATDAGLSALAQTLNRVSAALERLNTGGSGGASSLEPSTRRGEVAPGIARGAAPLRGVRRATPVPAL